MTAAPCPQRAVKSPLWRHNGRATAAHRGRRSLKEESPFACTSVSSLQYAWPLTYHMLAGSRRPYHAASEQHSHRCGVTTAEQLPPRWAAVGQRGVALSIHIIGWSHPLALFGAKTLKISSLIVRLDHTAAICLLARDARTMPSVSSIVAVVESQQWDDRHHGGPRSLKGQSPLVSTS